MLASFIHYFKKPSLLGLDVGCNELRLLQLTKRGQGYHIEKMLRHDLPPMAAGEETLDWDAIGGILQTFVMQDGLKGAEVAFALPAAAVLKKQLELSPLLTDHERLEALRQRLPTYFPGLSEDDIYFDFQAQREREEQSSWHVVAVRKEQLRHPLAVLRRAGLKPAIVDVDLYALARVGSWYFFQEEAEHPPAAALLDIRGSAFRFLAFNAQELFFYQQGRLEGPEASEENVIQQVKKLWQLCQTACLNRPVHFLGLAGEGRVLDALAGLLQAHFPFPVSVLRPFEKMTFAPPLQADLLHALSPRFLLCCGLAMRSGDLCCK